MNPLSMFSISLVGNGTMFPVQEYMQHTGDRLLDTKTNLRGVEWVHG